MNEVIRFNYLYRDSGNWKKFGSKKFSNTEQLTLEEIEQKIRATLTDQEYFYPDQVGIKKFKFHRYLDDYSWYEFESIELIENSYTSKGKTELIGNFILKLERMRNLEIYLISDQPTACPLCGARTKIINELMTSFGKPQWHRCLSEECNYSFVIEES